MKAITNTPPAFRSYRDSKAYLRSNSLRPDGRPRWPVTVEDYPSLPEAHANVARRKEASRLIGRIGGGMRNG